MTPRRLDHTTRVLRAIDWPLGRPDSNGWLQRQALQNLDSALWHVRVDWDRFDGDLADDAFESLVSIREWAEWTQSEFKRRRRIAALRETAGFEPEEVASRLAKADELEGKA